MPKPSVFRALLLEDEKPAREHLAAAINTHENLKLIAAVDTCAEAVQLLQHEQADIFVSDLSLPDGNGVKVIHEARKLHPNIEILVVTMFGDEEHVVEALEAGASGYLLKKQAFDELTDAMLCLLRGESAISPEIARFLLKRFQKEPAAIPVQINNPLTTREIDILTSIAKGYTYDEIGEVFSLSTNTVRAHIRNIYRKLSVNSRSEAVFEANQQGYITLA